MHSVVRCGGLAAASLRPEGRGAALNHPGLKEAFLTPSDAEVVTKRAWVARGCPDGIGTLVPALRRYAPVTAKGRAQRLGLGRAQAIWPWGRSRRSTGESDGSDELLVLSDQGHVGAWSRVGMEWTRGRLSAAGHGDRWTGGPDRAPSRRHHPLKGDAAATCAIGHRRRALRPNPHGQAARPPTRLTGPSTARSGPS